MRERFDRIAYIRRGLEQDGTTLQQLAYQLGLSRQRVAAIADDAGITARARMDCSHRLPQYHTEATLLRARALWDDGHSASQIGRRLTEEIGRRITKNAVIGIAHRNDFPPRSSPIRS